MKINKDDMIFCTLFDSNYLDKLLVMYYSLEKVSNQFKLFSFCFDRKSMDILQKFNLKNMVLISHLDIETDELRKIKKERSKAEYCWTCTPVIVEYVLKNFEVESCTYIDADLYFFSNPRIIFNEIDVNRDHIIITEHRFPNTVKGKKWLKKSGKYCVEFNYFDQSKEAWEALEWWKSKCFEWCYAKYEEDRMGDQKYLEKFPELFVGVHELQHLGAGVAPWNLSMYTLMSNSKSEIILSDKVNKKFPLIFFHFQNLKFLSSNIVNISSGTRDIKLKKNIYYPYLEQIYKYRKMFEKEYGVEYEAKRYCSSNKVKAFIQKYILQFKIGSLSDIVDISKLENKHGNSSY